jgi:hypothetical protein
MKVTKQFRCLGDLVGLYERYIQHSSYPVFVLLHFFVDAVVVPFYCLVVVSYNHLLTVVFTHGREIKQD